MPPFLLAILEAVLQTFMEDCISKDGKDKTARRLARNDRRDRVKLYRQTRDEVIASEGRSAWRHNKAAVRELIFSDIDADEAEDLIALYSDGD